MACKLAMQCNLIYGFLRCAIQEDMIDVHLKVCMLKGIHTFKKDYKSQTSRCSLWGAEVQPYPALRKKMVELMCKRQITTTPMLIRPTIPNQKNPRKETYYHLQNPIEAH